MQPPIRAFVAVALLLCALQVPAAAQQSRPFPLSAVTPPAATAAGRQQALIPDHDAIAALADLGDVVLRGARLHDGTQVDLVLGRLDVERLGFGFRVDGQPRPDLLEGLGLSVWKGYVRGEPGSEAQIAFSHHGSHGWIRYRGELVHLVPRPDASGDYMLGDVLVVTDASLAASGMRPALECGLEALPQSQGEAKPPPPIVQEQISGGGGCALKECTVAMETDYQLFQVWGSLSAMTAYVTTLLTFVSDRYETQVDTVLTFPYLQFYTTPADPWTSQDTGGSSVDLLYEFQAAWAGNVPAGAQLAHFMSGASLGGGVAWLDVLCNDQYNFGVSGNINGSVQFPVQQAPTNWDFMVVAHELGHNFASPHTHDFCPPLDECAPSGYFGQCQSSQVCTSSGTIMSYCHLCSGGTGNITTWFHPTAATVMRNAALACLPDFGGGITTGAPDLVAAGVATPLTVTVSGTPQAGVQLVHRHDAGSWTTVELSEEGAGTWIGELPATTCSQTLEYYVQYTDAICGPVTDPPAAPAEVFAPEVGTALLVFADDFEQDQGWFATNLGATSGDWERGVPVNDTSWAYAPAADFDGSGQCYLTENAPGNTDVDDGAVRLTSPSIDLSGGPARVSYAYYLRLTNQNGADRLLVEASDSGLSGPWQVVALHDTDGGNSWRTHTIHAGELAAAGLAPSADTRFRFTANDDDPQSIVEAGLDAFEVSVVTCQDPGPVAYCDPPNANSVSPEGCSLAPVSGEPGGVMTFQIDGTPLAPGVLYFGTDQIDLPFGCGRRCVGGAVVRSEVFLPGTTSFEAVLDTTGIAPTPFNIQYWYRDPVDTECDAGFNLSNALAY